MCYYFLYDKFVGDTLLGYILRQHLFAFVLLPWNLSLVKKSAHLVDLIRNIRKLIVVIDFHNWPVVDHPPANPV